jgi:hypothetical protein
MRRYSMLVKRISCFLINLNFSMLQNSNFAQRHAFHLVDPSALPLLTSVSALCLTTGSVLYFHGYTGGLEATFFGIACVLLCFFL